MSEAAQQQQKQQQKQPQPQQKAAASAEGGAAAGGKGKRPARKFAPRADIPDEELEPVTNEDGSLKKIEKPDDAAKESAVRELTNKIDSLLAERERIDKQQQSSRSGSKPYNDKRRTLVTALKEARAERSKLLDAASELAKKADALVKKDKDAKQKEKQAQQSLKFRSVEEVDAKIQELERKHTTVQLSRDQEKDMMKELSALKQTRRKLEEVQKQKAQSDASVDTSSVPALREAAHEKRAEADKLKEALDAKTQELDALTAQNKDVQGKADSLQKQRTDVQTQLNALFTERDAVKQAHNIKWRRFKLYLDKANKIRDAERKEREQQYKKEREEYERQVEEEELKKKPWEAEIAMCDFLVQHLEKLSGTKSSASASTAPAADASAADSGAKKAAAAAPAPPLRQSSDDFGGLQSVGKKTNDLDNFLVMGGAKKKSQKKNKAAAPTSRLTLSVDAINAFGDLSIKPPAKVEDVPAAVQALKEKRAYYDVLPRAPRKKRGGDAGASAAAAGAADKEAKDAEASDTAAADAPKADDDGKKKQAAPKKKTAAPSVESDELFPSLPGAKSPKPRPSTPSGGPSAVDMVKSTSSSSTNNNGSAAPGAAGPVSDNDPTLQEAAGQ